MGQGRVLLTLRVLNFVLSRARLPIPTANGCKTKLFKRTYSIDVFQY